MDEAPSTLDQPPPSARALATGARMRYYRHRAGLTLGQVATYARVSTSYLSRLERGEFEEPSANKLERIAERVGVSVSDLLDGRDDQASQALADPRWNLFLRRKQEAELDDHDEELLLRQAELALELLKRSKERP